MASLHRLIPGLQTAVNYDPGGGGGYFRNFWGGVCRWYPGTLDLYQSKLS